MADLGKARYSQVQPDTARYSAEKTHHVLYFRKAGASRISNMILRGMSGASIGASSGACLGHHLGHVWAMLSTMDNNGQQFAVLHASVMLF